MRQIVMKDLALIYTDVPTLRPGTLGAYAFALASAGVATVVRLAMAHFRWTPAVSTWIGNLTVRSSR